MAPFYLFKNISVDKRINDNLFIGLVCHILSLGTSKDSILLYFIVPICQIRETI